MPEPDPRVLVTGATGLLGPYLADAFAVGATVVTTSRHGGDLPGDLTSAAEARRILTDADPTVVVHAAALTDVDRCEHDQGEADAVNRAAVDHLASALAADRVLVVVSTDQVYPDRPGPHREGTEAPVNVYGRSKLAGERAAGRHPGALVLRTNFFGPSRSPGRESLSDWVAVRMAAGDAITLFEDVWFNPLHAATLAALAAAAVGAGLRGVFNVGSRVGCTKETFGLAVARHLGLPTDRARTGRSDDEPSRAPRPHDLRMDVRRFEEALGVALPDTRHEVERL